MRATLRFSTRLSLVTLAISAFSSLLVGVGGCDAAEDSGEPATPPVTEDSPLAKGMLALLNDPETSFELLDLTVGLDRRAAENLVLHRDGLDRLAGTSDDDPFDSVAEVDAVRWVGPAAVARLLGWVEAEGWLPLDERWLGTTEGILFRVWEAEATVAFANAAAYEELDQELGLDRRAAGSILAARPLADVARLAELPYVGPVTLRTLRDHAAQAFCERSRFCSVAR